MSVRIVFYGLAIARLYTVTMRMESPFALLRFTAANMRIRKTGDIDIIIRCYLV